MEVRRGEGSWVSRQSSGPAEWLCSSPQQPWVGTAAVFLPVSGLQTWYPVASADPPPGPCIVALGGTFREGSH